MPVQKPVAWVEWSVWRLSGRGSDFFLTDSLFFSTSLSSIILVIFAEYIRILFLISSGFIESAVLHDVTITEHFCFLNVSVFFRSFRTSLRRKKVQR